MVRLRTSTLFGRRRGMLVSASVVHSAPPGTAAQLLETYTFHPLRRRRRVSSEESEPG